MPDAEPRLILRQGDLMWHSADNDIVTLDLPTGECFAINAPGAVLWGRLQAGTSRTELVHVLCDTYGIPAEQAGDDVDAFVSQLAARGLLG